MTSKFHCTEKQSQILKEKGFNEYCFLSISFFDNTNNSWFVPNKLIKNSYIGTDYTIPLKYQAINYICEKLNLVPSINNNYILDNEKFCYGVLAKKERRGTMDFFEQIAHTSFYNCFEDAQAELLDKLIDLLIT